jgi:hypothetical protein
MRLRSATVEPVWGTLLHFRKLKKVYTKGNALAHKQVLMASAAYNLKKLMSFRNIKSVANVMKNMVADVKSRFSNQILQFFQPEILELNGKLPNVNPCTIYNG